MRPLLRSIYEFLASLKLAVVLLLSLAAILATATYYESKYDTKTAHHLVYSSPWFYVFLFMLGVNVFCAAAIRYPWKRHQTGFVVTHLGILIILLGSFITLATGFEGDMALASGDTSNTVTIDKPTISYQVVTGRQGHGALDESTIRSLPAEFRWSPPTDASPRRIPLANGLVLVVDRYYNHAVGSMQYTNDGPAFNPALQFRLAAGPHTPKMGPFMQGGIMAEDWLALADPQMQQAQMGPASIRIMSAPDADTLQRLLAPAPHVSRAAEGLLVFEVAGRHPVVSVEGNVGKTVPVPGSPYRVRIDRYMPYAVVEHNHLVNRSNEPVNPAVDFTVLDSQGEAEKHLEFARFPQFNTTHHRKRPTTLRVAYTFTDPNGPSNGVDFIIGPHHELHYKIRSDSGAVRAGLASEGRAIPTGWKMGLMVTVVHYYPNARARRVYRDFRPARGKEGPPPAVRVRVEGADDPGPYWLQQGDDVVVTRGQQVTRIFYHLQGLALGCHIKLDKFTVGYDPGTRTAASYASDVEVEEAASGRHFPYHISMNHPLHFKGVTFFQASFDEDSTGKPTVSILQVARDPGVPVKYAGSILLVCGIALQFWWKPGRSRRRAGSERPREKADERPPVAEDDREHSSVAS